MKMLQTKKEKLFDLLSIIKKNGGVTTSNGIDIVNLKCGYAVGLLGKKIILSDDNLDNISRLCTAVYDLLTIKKDNQYIGYWIDKKNVLYIDIVSIQNDFNFAMKLARVFNQSEIYSFSNQKCYTVSSDTMNFEEMKKATKEGGFKNA